MKLIKNLGMRYPTKNAKKRRMYGEFLCSCGNIVDKPLWTRSNSCGKCGRLHGMAKHPLYQVHTNMIARCKNEKNPNFKHYGGRGISVCDEWVNDINLFFGWAFSNGYSMRLSIDRVNNDGNYEPSNCRWVTQSVQANNNRKIIRTNTSGYRGVSWDKNRGKFMSSVNIKNKTIHIGRFKTAKEAAIARDEYIDSHNLTHIKNFS